MNRLMLISTMEKTSSTGLECLSRNYQVAQELTFDKGSLLDADAAVIYGDKIEYLEKQVEQVRSISLAVPVIVITSNRDIRKDIKYRYVTNDIITLPADNKKICARINMVIEEAPLIYLRYYHFANILSLAGEYEKSWSAYEGCLELNQDFLPGYVDYAVLCYRMKEYDLVKKILKRGKEHYPDDPDLMLIKARIAVKERKLDKAERLYRACVKYGPFSFTVLVELFFLLVKRKKAGAAIKSTWRGFSQLLELKEKMRHYIHIAQKYAEDEDVLYDARMALCYFPEDDEFNTIFETYRNKVEKDG